MAIAHFELSNGPALGRFIWQPSPLLLTPGNTLQGGAGLGVAVAAMESVAQRPTIWATAQYLSFAVGTSSIEVDVAIAVTGHNTTQARCVLSRDGKEILTAHGALGQREFEFEGVWCSHPDVDPPEICPRYRFFESGHGHIGDHAEFRLARGRQLDEIETSDVRGDGSFALWIRCWRGQQLVSVADLAFVGDFMPLGFADASGKPYAGNSLDNTIRVGKLVETEWILLAVHVQQIANGFGYGRAELWAEDGTLLGEVSQSAVLRTHAHIQATTRSAN